LSEPVMNKVDVGDSYFLYVSGDDSSVFFADGVVPQKGDVVELVCTKSIVEFNGGYEVGFKLRVKD
jgi:hypothetical protein